VETVGVGQSEYAVADLVDMFTLLVAPGGGDDLQGIKKGIVEMADLLVVTKSDGDLSAAANRAFHDYRSALQMLRPESDIWRAKVMKCSAHTGDGIDAVWDAMTEFRQIMTDTGQLAAKRADQAASWMWDEVTASLLEKVRAPDGPAAKLEAEVRNGTRIPSEAARLILSRFKA